MCSCSTELSVVSADSFPVTFESPQPPLVVVGLKLSGMSAQTKSFAGVSEPLRQPYVWYAQYLFVLHEVRASLQSTMPFGRKMKYIVESPYGHPFELMLLKTSVLRSVWVTGAANVPACGKAVVSTTDVTKFDVSAGEPLLPEYCVVVFRICVPPTILEVLQHGVLVIEVGRRGRAVAEVIAGRQPEDHVRARRRHDLAVAGIREVLRRIRIDRWRRCGRRWRRPPVAPAVGPVPVRRSRFRGTAAHLRATSTVRPGARRHASADATAPSASAAATPALRLIMTSPSPPATVAPAAWERRAGDERGPAGILRPGGGHVNSALEPSSGSFPHCAVRSHPRCVARRQLLGRCRRHAARRRARGTRVDARRARPR